MWNLASVLWITLWNALATFFGMSFSWWWSLEVIVLSSCCLSIEMDCFSSLFTDCIAFFPTRGITKIRFCALTLSYWCWAEAPRERSHAWPVGGSIGTCRCVSTPVHQQTAMRPWLTFVRLNSLSFITDHKSGMNIFTCVLLSTYNI